MGQAALVEVEAVGGCEKLIRTSSAYKGPAAGCRPLSPAMFEQAAVVTDHWPGVLGRSSCRARCNFTPLQGALQNALESSDW